MGERPLSYIRSMAFCCACIINSAKSVEIIASDNQSGFSSALRICQKQNLDFSHLPEEVNTLYSTLQNNSIDCFEMTGHLYSEKSDISFIPFRDRVLFKQVTVSLQQDAGRGLTSSFFSESEYPDSFLQSDEEIDRLKSDHIAVTIHLMSNEQEENSPAVTESCHTDGGGDDDDPWEYFTITLIPKHYEELDSEELYRLNIISSVWIQKMKDPYRYQPQLTIGGPVNCWNDIREHFRQQEQAGIRPRKPSSNLLKIISSRCHRHRHRHRLHYLRVACYKQLRGKNQRLLRVRKTKAQ